jgi:hypothetical protein
MATCGPQSVDDRKCDMRRSTRHWIAAGSVLLFAALILIAYLAFVGIAYADPAPRGPAVNTWTLGRPL